MSSSSSRGSSESSDRPSLRVAVIGAGAAGLVAARYFRDAGFEVVVWEMAEEVGGTWLFSEAVTEGRGNLYRSLRTNLPKEIMQFSDLPFEGDLPSFVQHTEVARYLRRYADVFDLRPLICFNTKVLRVERLPPPPPRDSSSSSCLATRPGRLWEVTHQRHRPAQVSSSSSSQAENGKPVHDVDGSGRVRDGNGRESSPQADDRSNGEETSRFDIVLVCNGHFSKTYTPAFEGLDTFPGAVMHSKRYREPTPFAGKTVVMVGAGASGVDITKEVSGVARKVYACVRGKPSPPPSLRSGCAAKTAVADVFGHSPALELKLGCEIVRATCDGYITFSDGSRTESPVDALVFCTGYHYHLPFLAPSCRVFFHPNRARRALSGTTAAAEAGSNGDGGGGDDIEAEEGEGKSVWSLYEHVLHVEHPSLAFIGLNWKVLPFACFEVQTRFALALMRHPHFLAWDADPDLDSHIDDPKYARASSHLPAPSHYSGTTDVCGDGDDDGGLEEGREEDKRFPSTKRTLADRLWAEWDAGSIVEATGGADSASHREQQQRVKDYHMLGSHQWAYYRHLHRLSCQANAAAARCRRVQPDEAGPAGGQQRRDWRRVREVYEDVGRARLQDPDTYRRRQYTFCSPDPAVASWRVHVPVPRPAARESSSPSEADVSRAGNNNV